MLISMGEVITKDGGLSADYTFTVIISICGSLIIFVLGFAFHNINSTLKSLTKNFAEFKDEFHEFTRIQSALNERFEQRTKDL